MWRSLRSSHAAGGSKVIALWRIMFIADGRSVYRLSMSFDVLMMLDAWLVMKVDVAKHCGTDLVFGGR